MEYHGNGARKMNTKRGGFPSRFALIALVFMFVVPSINAEPEVRDISDATVFVDGAVDYIEFAAGGGLGVVTTWTLTAPDGKQMSFQSTSTNTGNNQGG